MENILLIEDDKNLGESLKKYLVDQGYGTHLAKTLEEARALDLKEFKLILLDWMLPDGQGLDFLKELRTKKVSTPIIMLTARTELIDKILGLESGANDYMAKPFEPRELVARIRVQLRNKSYNGPKENDRLTNGLLVMDLIKREVTYNSKLQDLTKMEFELLKLLLSSPGRAYSREELLNKVWGFENYISTRTVDTHVLQLRQKLDDSLIETIRGVGYKMRQID